jgi:hypothetical protein
MLAVPVMNTLFIIANTPWNDTQVTDQCIAAAICDFAQSAADSACV